MSKILKNNISEIRKLKGISILEISEKLKISENNFQSIEKGDFNPPVKLSLKIASILQTPAGELFYIED